MTTAENSTQGQSSQVEAQAVETPVAPIVTSEQQASAEAPKQETPVAETPKANDEEVIAAKAEAPVELTDFTAPEGITLDPEAAGEFKSLAKELGLKQDSAQKIADIGAKLSQKWEARQAEAIEKVRNEWIESSKADKEFGGDKLQENLSVAKKAMDAFGTPELRSLLNESGIGNHPEIVRAFYRAGKSISEDRFVSGGTSPVSNREPSKVLYPNQK